jgi:cytokinin dehydrogenase
MPNKHLNFAMETSTKSPFLEEIRGGSLGQYFHSPGDSLYRSDFGNMVSYKPLGVFTPKRIDHLQEFVVLAGKHKVQISCRGGGNSAYGQAQVQGGVIIDLKDLDVSLNYAAEDKSCVRLHPSQTWYDLVRFTEKEGLTVSVTVDNMKLTIGGVISFGGIGCTSHKFGSCADTVIGLEVVTLDGRLHKCSDSENEELFKATLCGLGQFGIIVNATVKTIKAKRQVHEYKFEYADQSSFLKDQKIIYDSKILDFVKGNIMKKENKLVYTIRVATFFDEVEDSEVSRVLSQLTPNNQTDSLMDYFKFINLNTDFIDQLRNDGKLNYPHPWYTAFVPEKHIQEHLSLVIKSPHLMEQDAIIVYPMDSHTFKKPFFARPQGTFYLVGVFFNTSFTAHDKFPFEEVLEQNKMWHSQLVTQGGYRYPIDAIPFSSEDWRNHFGARWDSFCDMKERYDPHHLLGSGFGIFS